MVFTVIPLVGGLAARPDSVPSVGVGFASPTHVMTPWEEINPWNEGMHALWASPGKGESRGDSARFGVTAYPRTGRPSRRRVWLVTFPPAPKAVAAAVRLRLPITQSSRRALPTPPREVLGRWGLLSG